MTDPTSRALSLLGMLQSRPSWSGQELAERLGVTTRTLRRDVDRLRDLGYTVNADAGPGGGYSLGRGEAIPPLLLDEEQAIAVTIALTQTAQTGDGPHAEAALRALATIDDVIPAAVRHRLQALRDATSITRASSATSVSADLLMPCAEAIRRSVRLTFTYRDRRGAATDRTVEPHRLIAERHTWRLVAYDLDRDDWRTFRLDRLTLPTPGTWRFTPRPDLDDALADLDRPTPPEAWRHQVTVHIHAPLATVTESLPHLAGHLRSLDETTTEFRTGADDPRDAAWWLARLDHDFTVIGDDTTRDAVARLGRRLQRAASPGRAGEGDER